jgi:hypothetical protein
LNGDLEETDHRGEPVTGTTLLLGFNLAAGSTEWTLPGRRFGGGWRRILDTSLPETDRRATTLHAPEDTLDLPGRSVVVLEVVPG